MPLHMKGVDHILIGARNLDAAVSEFERLTGLAPVRGGKHPLAGTENALVSLGDNIYLELIAPQSDTKATDTFVSELRSLEGLALVGWAAHVSEVADARMSIERQGFVVSQPKPGSRVTPEGKTLQWVTFGLERPLIETAPFFIRWGEGVTHPSQSSPRGCSVIAFDIYDPRASDLSRVLSSAGVDVPVKQAEHPHMRLTLRCGDRESSFVSR